MATKKLSKAKREIITQVRERWTNTVLNGTPNIEKAKECLRAAYQNGVGSYKKYETIKEPAFHVVHSPIAFGLAHAIKRGRVAKKRVRDICYQTGLDYSQFANLRKDRMLRWRPTPPRWYAHSETEFSRTWLRAVDSSYIELESKMAADRNSGVRRRRWGRGPAEIELDLCINSFDIFTTLSRSLIYDSNPGPSSAAAANAVLNEFLNYILIDSNSTAQSMNTLHDAYRAGIERLKREAGDEVDETDGVAPVLRHEILPEDAEIFCRFAGITDPSVTWEHEVFHHLTAFATFEDSCLILAARPTMLFDSDGELHNETGPAVTWPDGMNLWFNHGHFLDEGGKEIITSPQTLTTEKILDISNEETRRVAIDRFGWEKFLSEADCPVIDRRQNDIDNTIEILVGSPAREAHDWRRTNRMILFCRSTGRRYFLTVPADTTSCAEAQHWMADSNRIESSRVPYASHEMRLVGAS
jgi:hypothetical protein